jgi:hypothetical protein
MSFSHRSAGTHVLDRPPPASRRMVHGIAPGRVARSESCATTRRRGVGCPETWREVWQCSSSSRAPGLQPTRVRRYGSPETGESARGSAGSVLQLEPCRTGEREIVSHIQRPARLPALRLYRGVQRTGSGTKTGNLSRIVSTFRSGVMLRTDGASLTRR